MNSTFANKALEFYSSLNITIPIPRGIGVMNPYTVPETRALTERFLKKFYSDSRKRVLVMGINPGRFGGARTGIGFTDPVALEIFCGIRNTLEKRREVSSEFVYRFIEQYGGPKRFFGRFFLSAVSPLGFIKSGMNYNYYDNKGFSELIEPFIVDTLQKQIALGISTDTVVVLGIGKNEAYVRKLNDKYRFFKKIIALEHPRFIMQYRRKKLPWYLEKYGRAFSKT